MPIADVNGGALYYFELGQGTPLIFIHPPVIDSLVFSYQIAELSRRFRTIVFDIQGHGKSAAKETPVNYTTIAADAVGLLDWLGLERGVFCGYSTGAAVVLECLLEYPHRAIAAVMMGGMAEARHWWLRSLLTMAKATSVTPLKWLLTVAVVAVNSNQFPYFIRQCWRIRQGNPKKWAEYLSASRAYNCTSELTRIDKPVLMVYGAKDTRFHPDARQIHALLPASRLVLLAGAGHQMPTKAPRSVSAQIEEFLSQELKL